MTDYEIMRDICLSFSAFASGVGVPIALPDANFTPPDSGHWLELDIAPNNFDDTLADQYAYKRGVITLSVVFRKGSSQYEYGEAYQLVDDIASGYPKETVLSGSAVVSSIPRPLSQIEYQDRIMIPVSIEYSE